MAQPDTIKSGDPRNDVNPVAPRGYSNFNYSHRFLQTHRFGEISPCESFETMKGAEDSFRLQSDTSSLSLKAPIKTDMFQKHSNFFVPLQAIIPNSWELVTAQPNNGDDAPKDADGVVSTDLLNEYFLHLLSSISAYSQNDSMTASNFSFLLKLLLQAEMFFSQGSLCKNLYLDFTHCVKFVRFTEFGEKRSSFDAFLEKVLNAYRPVSSQLDGVHSFIITWYDEDGNKDGEYLVVNDSLLSENPAVPYPAEEGLQRINIHHCLDLCRQNLCFTISSVDGLSDLSDWSDYFFGDYYNENEEGAFSPGVNYVYIPVVKEINFDKLSAYQLCCAHFFSLDHVDYIYSAELYRQLMNFYSQRIYSSLNGDDSYSGVSYQYNGLLIRYDALSGFAINNCFEYLSNSLIVSENSSAFTWGYCFLTALFSFRHSLRYLDYFTGSRTRPLSIGAANNPAGDPTVPVVNNQVNAVDVIIAQNAARYLNFAQRVGRKISKWLDKLFPGGQPRPDMHDPQWLSSTGDALNPEQTQNTGDAQMNDANSITARFKNDSNRYMFTCRVDRPGYIICVTYYDVPRSYAFATAKENFHVDRYDRFNPFFQYNGSQPVDRQELGLPGDAPFSYQNKYEEFKQNYDVVAGGFVEFLPGFAFIADLQSGLPMQQNLNPTYVRSWNTELDPFYVSLTGLGLAAYYHFIVKNVNLLSFKRPMEYSPQLM